jgi:hypothetical protein
MMVHYDRNNPGKIIQQKIVPGDDNHPNSCEKGNEQSRNYQNKEEFEGKRS